MKPKIWAVLLFMILPLVFSGCSFTKNDFYSKHNDDCTFGEWVIIKEPTCTTSGRKEQYCLQDNRHVHIIEQGMLGHSYDDNVITIQPTCTTKGEQADICKRCGYKTKVITLSSTGHKFGSWIIDETTECVEVKHRLCLNDCDEVEFERTENHAWDADLAEIIKKPNCTEPGLVKLVCKNDHTHIMEIIDPVIDDAHGWGDWQTDEKDPTKEVRVCLYNEKHKQWRDKI